MGCSVSELETNSRPLDCVDSQQEINNEEDGENNTSETLLPPVLYSLEGEPKTPKRVNKRPREDTPRVDRIQEKPVYRSSFVRSQRNKLIKSIKGVAFMETIENFLKYALPPLKPEFDIDHIYTNCLKDGILKKKLSPEGYKWDRLLNTPSDVKMGESDVYKPLENIFNKITEIAEKLTETRHESYLHVDGNNTYWSEKIIDIKPDALIFLENSKDNCPSYSNGQDWYNVVCSLEFKKLNRYKETYEVIHSLPFKVS